MPDLSGQESVRSGSPALAWKRQLAISSALLACVLVFGVTLGSSQSLGDIARQDRARKERQPRRATRVYTDEDLARPQILDPEDRVRFEAARKNWRAPWGEQTAEVCHGVPQSAEISLGDVARRYRLLKQIQETRESNKAHRLPREAALRSEEHTSELQSPCNLVCRLLLEKKKNIMNNAHMSIY